MFRYPRAKKKQSGFFIGQQHEKAKKITFSKRFFRHVSGKIDVDMAVFTLSKGKFEGKISADLLGQKYT